MLPINTATATAVRDAIAQTERTEKSVAEGAKITTSTWQRHIHGQTSFTINDLSRISAEIGMKIGDLVAAIAEKLR